MLQASGYCGKKADNSLELYYFERDRGEEDEEGEEVAVEEVEVSTEATADEQETPSLFSEEACRKADHLQHQKQIQERINRQRTQKNANNKIKESGAKSARKNKNKGKIKIPSDAGW